MKASRRLVRIATHEAGHAVAALALGVRVAGIVVSRDVGFVSYQQHADDDAVVVSLAGPVAEAKHNGKVYPWESYTHAVERSARLERLDTGGAALPSRLGSASCDGLDVRDATREAAPSRSWMERVDAWHKAQSRARSLVDDRWDDIQALARYVLKMGGTLTESELAAWWAGRSVAGGG